MGGCSQSKEDQNLKSVVPVPPDITNKGEQKVASNAETVAAVAGTMVAAGGAVSAIAGQAATAAGESINSAAGQALLSLAAEMPFIAPLAYLVGAIVVSCKDAEGLSSDCAEFGILCKEIERSLLSAQKLGDHSDTVEGLVDILEEGMAFIKAVKKANKFITLLSGSLNKQTLLECRDRAVILLQTLSFGCQMDFHRLQSMKFEEEKVLAEMIEQMGGAEEVTKNPEKLDEVMDCMKNHDKLMCHFHKETHRNQRATIAEVSSLKKEMESQSKILMQSQEQAALMMKQNEILTSQVAQMVSMMQHFNSARDYMQMFPINPQEAQRVLNLEDLKLFDLPLPCRELERIANGYFVEMQENNIPVNIMFFNCMGEMVQRAIIVRCKGPDGEVYSDMPFRDIPKNAASCRYVVASDSMVCLRSKDQDDGAKMKWAFNPDNQQMIADMSETDPVMAEFASQAQAPASQLMMGLASGQMTMEHALAELAKLDEKDSMEPHSFKGGAACFSALFAKDDIYAGVPVKWNGHVIGTACIMYKDHYADGEPVELTPQEIKDKLGLQDFANDIRDAIVKIFNESKGRLAPV